MEYPEAYLRFIDLFNEGQFWESHEVLEEPWLTNRSEFYKGLIIFASAFVHAGRGNPVGVRKQMEKCLRYLPPYEPDYMGLSVTSIVDHARRCISLACQWEEAGKGSPTDIPLYTFSIHPSRVRGDEPELGA